MKSKKKDKTSPTPRRKATARGRGTIEDCARLGSTPQVKIINGHRFRWVGIGWIDEGKVSKSK
jgi:hypothetical protein